MQEVIKTSNLVQPCHPKADIKEKILWKLAVGTTMENVNLGHDVGMNINVRTVEKPDIRI